MKQLIISNKLLTNQELINLGATSINQDPWYFEAVVHSSRVLDDGGSQVFIEELAAALQPFFTNNVFDVAKLIWVPNAGLKTNKLYCVKPFNGSGDLVISGTMPAIGNSMVLSNSHNVSLPSSGFGEVKTLIINNVAHTYPAGRDLNGYRLLAGTFNRIFISDTVIDNATLTALGCTTIYNDAWVIGVEGNPTNPATPTTGTMTFSATANLDVYYVGNASGTITRSNDAFWNGVQLRRHDVTVNCPNGGRGEIVVVGGAQLRSLGNHKGSNEADIAYYNGNDSSMPRLRLRLNDLQSTVQKIRSFNVNTTLVASGNNSLPSSLTELFLFNSNGISYNSNSPMPTALRILWIENCFSFNWTGNTIGNSSTPKPNMLYLRLYDFRNPSNTMDYPDLLTWLDSLINNVGTLPTTVIINEQIPSNVTAIQAALPLQDGTLAEQAKWKINWIKTNKNVTSFQLNEIAI